MIAVGQHGRQVSKRTMSYRVDTVPWPLRPLDSAVAAYLR